MAAQPTSHNAWRRPTLVALALIAAVAVWSAGVRPMASMQNFGVVDEGAVYRSAESTASALAGAIEARGIRTVIDFGAFDEGSREQRREQRVCDALGVERVELRLYGDGTGDPNQYVRALTIMTNPERQPVLVHCAAGAQRTGVAVALYRHLAQGWSLHLAHAEATEYRHDPDDNPWVRYMLETYAEDIERALASGGHVPTLDKPGTPPPGGLIPDAP